MFWTPVWENLVHRNARRGALRAVCFPQSPAGPDTERQDMIDGLQATARDLRYAAQSRQKPGPASPELLEQAAERMLTAASYIQQHQH